MQCMRRLMQVTVIRSKRRTVAIQVKADLQLVVRAPFWTTEKEIDRILKDNAVWIEKHLALAREKAERQKSQEDKKLTDAEIQELADRALKYIPGRVAFLQKRSVSATDALPSGIRKPDGEAAAARET